MWRVCALGVWLKWKLLHKCACEHVCVHAHTFPDCWKLLSFYTPPQKKVQCFYKCNTTILLTVLFLHTFFHHFHYDLPSTSPLKLLFFFFFVVYFFFLLLYHYWRWVAGNVCKSFSMCINRKHMKLVTYPSLSSSALCSEPLESCSCPCNQRNHCRVETSQLWRK